MCPLLQGVHKARDDKSHSGTVVTKVVLKKLPKKRTVLTVELWPKSNAKGICFKSKNLPNRWRLFVEHFH